MAATADPPAELEPARRSLDELGSEVVTHGVWRRPPVTGLGTWMLELELRPSGIVAGGSIPPSTSWIVLVADDYPRGQINVMPAATGGITGTFPHQEPNDPPDPAAPLPWRTGKVCLVDTLHGHELAAKRNEPDAAYDRLRWHVARTLEWLRRASDGTLLASGEPFELPVFGQFTRIGPRVGFCEDAETFRFWSGYGGKIGYVDQVVLAESWPAPTLAAQVWFDEGGKEILRPAWGRRIAGHDRRKRSVWFRFDRLPVREPWRSPQTIGELIDFGHDQGVDIEDILKKAAHVLRDGQSHHVMVGFPIPSVLGDLPSLMHWTSFRLPPLTDQRGRRRPILNGFRDSAAAWVVDRRAGGPLADDAAISWSKTENWAPDELAARGRFEHELAAVAIFVIGAGALGASISELLVRGGVRKLTVVDPDLLEAPNLARHDLVLGDVGRSKAEALAFRLNEATPNARVEGYQTPFPPPDGEAVGALDEADLVIDTTGSDAVIQDLGRREWPRAARFASISFSFGAEHLYLFTASGTSFPVPAFRRAIEPWLEADERPMSDFPHEGTGCWSSVFPARADDVFALAATATRHLDSAPRAAGPRFVVFAREPDGTIGKITSPQVAAAVFRAPDGSAFVELEEAAAHALLEISREGKGRETGGVLIGRYTKDGNRVIVTAATEPPPDSRRGPTSFIRGVRGLGGRLTRAWDTGVYYVGEWHLHPKAAPVPSPTDLGTVIGFARDPGYRCPHPVLIVVGGGPTQWLMSVGAILEGRYVQLEVEVSDGNPAED